MINDNKKFDTNIFFSGGAGMFIQYHDIVKPVYLYAIIKMIIMKESYGLPLYAIENMSTLSIIEWYMKRRFKNPLMCLDYNRAIDKEKLDSLMQEILLSDSSIYKLSPSLNIYRLLQSYHRCHMSFPIFVYSEYEEPYIKDDCKYIFNGIDVKYIYGDLKDAINKCDQNFTYIFSDIDLVKNASKYLFGTCSHVLIARDYRYNYIDNCKNFKYNLDILSKDHPYIRIGTTIALDMNELAISLNRLRVLEEEA